MDKNNKFFLPINAKESSRRQDEKWDQALALFNNKQYELILPTLLQYVGIDPESKKVNGVYEVSHGSVVLSIEQTATELKIRCPFLDISNAKKIPLMRRLAEIRMSPLNLTNVVLEGSLVYFSFSCPLELCEPYKIYSVLREICFYADSYDDEFIEKFDATHLQEPKIIAYSDEVKKEAYANCQEILEDGIERFNHFMEKRDFHNAWYTLNISLKKIEFYAEPQGYLRGWLEKSIDKIFDGNVPFQNRLLEGKSSLEKLKDYPIEKFSDDLYQKETFITHKYSGKKENIRENWEDSYSDVQETMSNAKYEDASTLITSCFYNLFYYNLVDETISQPVTDAMNQASGLPFSQAAPILFKGMQAIMEDNFDGNPFGMDLSKMMGEQMQQSMAAMQQIMANFKID